MPVELRKSLKKTRNYVQNIRRYNYLKKLITFVTANIRRIIKKFKKKHGITYGDIQSYDYLKKLIIKDYGD